MFMANNASRAQYKLPMCTWVLSSRHAYPVSNRGSAEQLKREMAPGVFRLVVISYVGLFFSSFYMTDGSAQSDVRANPALSSLRL